MSNTKLAAIWIGVFLFGFLPYLALIAYGQVSPVPGEPVASNAAYMDSVAPFAAEHPSWLR